MMRARFDLGARALEHRLARAVDVQSGSDAVDPLAASSSRGAQSAFVERMREAGVDASDRPTEGQLREYFRTFDHPARREEALTAFEEYAGAFHAHAGSVQYDADPEGWVVGDRLYETEAEALSAAGRRRDGAYSSVQTRTPESFADVQRSRGMDGRYENDCQGFDFLAGQLLAEAGFEVEHVVAGAEGSSRMHAMTRLRDPQSGDAHLQSNGRISRGGSRDDLEGAYVEAGGELPRGASLDVYSGATPREAEAFARADVD